MSTHVSKHSLRILVKADEIFETVDGVQAWYAKVATWLGAEVWPWLTV